MSPASAGDGEGMNEKKTGLSIVERFVSLFTKMRPGEGPSVLLFGLNAFLILVCYYILKTIREALILTEFDAEVRSYATATQALLLMFLVPLYGVLFRSSSKTYLIRWVTLFFIANTVIFYVAANAGLEVGFFYFVFVGIYGVMVIAQFWAFAADCFNVKSGQRLFPVIMIGASAGALAGGNLTEQLTSRGIVSPVGMMLVSALILATTLVLNSLARNAIPNESRSVYSPDDDEEGKQADHFLGGFAIVMRDRYLLLIAALVILLNWVNTTGETILADFVSRYADGVVAAEGVSKGEVVAAFYGNFFFWVNLAGFAIQAFLVARIYRWIGVSGAILILPVVAVLGYGLMVFVPIFSIIRLVKIFENSVDYSVMNTTRQALFLPTDRAAKYEGKTTIDTFFWRFGDLIQAGAFYVGLNVLGLSITQFAILNLFLALVWLGLAIAIGRHYRHLVKTNVLNVAPELNRAIPDVEVAPGASLSHALAPDTFIDNDPGDVMPLSARLAGGAPLPAWLVFDAREHVFRGRVPRAESGSIQVEVVATDFEGLSASGTFHIHCRALVVTEGGA
jgi:AAA family ATP:ADP antiporter